MRESPGKCLTSGAMTSFRARLLLLLLAGALQFQQLGRAMRFHPDEAYFMTFARSAAVNGDWLLPGALDKAPLTIYLSAISMVATGLFADDNGVLHLDPLQGEFAARLPNVMLALLLVGLMMRLSGVVFRDELAALLAGLLTALSPYLLAFGASAFTDMGLLFFYVLTLYCLAQRRFAAAGLALGLAFWCKQQAIFILPLAALLFLMQFTAARPRRAAGLRQALLLCLPLTLLALLLFLWDAARPETSLFLLGSANNLPQEWLAEPAQWTSRLLEWARLGAWLLGPPIVTATLLGLGILGRFAAGAAPRKQSDTRIYLIYIVAYITLHSALAFNQYDRYLLLVLPPLILVLSGHLPALFRRARNYKSLWLSLALVLVFIALCSLRLGLPIGGDRGAHDGINDLARALNSKPVATVIYDPWLGWELAYYMGQWSDKRRVHYPTAEALVAGALELDEVGDRYLAAPVDRGHEDWAAALEAAGFALSIDYRLDRFVVYRLRSGQAADA